MKSFSVIMRIGFFGALLMHCTGVHADDSGIIAANCPITVGQAPDDQAWKDLFSYGSDVLAVKLYVDGWWRGFGAERNYRGRTWWSSEGYNGLADPVPPLSVSGRRLDAHSEPAVTFVTNATDADYRSWAMIVMIEFPSAGCWELTGEYGGQTLTYVVLVGEHERSGKDDA